MKTLTIGNGLRLPKGARLVRPPETFYTSMYAPNDTYTERIVLDVCGYSVQILRYDRDDDGVAVFVGGNGQIMCLDEVVAYIERMTG